MTAAADKSPTIVDAQWRQERVQSVFEHGVIVGRGLQASTSARSGHASAHSDGSSSSCLAPRTAENCMIAAEMT